MSNNFAYSKSWRDLEHCSCVKAHVEHEEFLLDRNSTLLVAQCQECFRYSCKRTYCNHENKRIALRPVGNGKAAYEQCMDCGDSIGGAISQKAIPENQKPLPDFIPLKKGNYDYFELIADLDETRKSYMSEEGKRRHEDYLQSGKWKRMREKVLERDRFLCQSCLTERATEVHHHSYDNLGSEFAWELVSICRKCHERYHEQQQ